MKINRLIGVLNRIAAKPKSDRAEFIMINESSREGIMGLFKPTWESSDREKALRAIDKLTDPKQLEQAALTAPNAAVREAAVNKITDPVALAKAVQNDKNEAVSNTALSRLNDTKMLAALVLSGKNGIIQSFALEKISDQEVLRDIVLVLSADPKRNNGMYDRTWINALEKITDQKALAQIAVNAKSDRIKLDTACKLTDTALAERVLLSLTRSELIQLRFDAAGQLTDAKAAQRVYYDVLSDKSKSDWHERALIQLSDQSLLIESAKTVTDLKIRLKIAEKISDEKVAQPIFAEIAQSGADGCTRLRAAERMTDKETAQAVYISVAKSDKRYESRVNAVQKITDQPVLAELAKTDNELKVQKAAVERITDQALLLELLNTVKGQDLKQAVCGKIGHEWDKETGCKTCRVCGTESHLGPIDEKDAGGHAVNQTCTACGKMIGHYFTDW
ncbi:MAG TPA: hypothetical protein PK854_08735 [Oscillospiraceae bacterium]|nr:hypothetical protein [Oscillospiraceae bacterium]HPS35338.1 hypothetical protein [Oscillospiraceae bacterium]